MKSEIILHDHSVTFETNEPVVEKDGLVVNIVGGIGPRGTKGDTPVKGVDYFTEEDIDEISDAAAGKVYVPTNVSELENDAGYLTEHQNISGKADKDEIPTRVSELENDMGYLTEHQDVSGKADKSELPTKVSELENDAGYLTAHQDISQKADKSELPTKVSQLENDEGYLTQHQDISHKADKSEIPTRVGELENDVGYLTEHQDISNKADKSEIPVNVSELVNDAGYLTQHQDVSNKAEKSEIPTRVSELENDTGYITGYTETDPTVPEWAKRSVKPSYTAAEVGALPDDTHIPSTTGELENDAGFITADDLPVNVSELTNDAGYLTTETDPTVPAWAKAAQKPAYTAAEVGATTEQQVSEMIANAVPEVPVQDVQINGTTVVQNGVANVPVASSSTPGVMRINTSRGFEMDGDALTFKNASDAQLKAGSNQYRPITPSTQYAASFYGLAKAAGDTTQSQSDNSVGTYTDEAKAAIQTMLDVPAKSDIPDVPVQDVQVDGVSVLNNGVASIEAATASKAGVVIVNPTYGMYMTNRHIVIQPQNDSTIKKGTWSYGAITPEKQHLSTFYGLAKAAGHDEKDSVLSAGQYTDEAKAAIQTMLDVPSKSDIPDIPVQDVQVNGTSVVNNETANIPVANDATFGVIRTSQTYGTGIHDGQLQIQAAPASHYKSGGGNWRPVVPSHQHESTFYGLAKAAGDTSQSVSSNTVGTYTDEAKAAIQNMLDVPSNTDLAQAISDVEEKIQHMYICSAAEYNSETGVPTVANPDSKTFYLVPSSEGSPNLYIEWVYLNNTWERFGSATIDLSNYVQFSDYASADKAGVVKVDDNGTGITITPNGKIRITPAQLDQIKAGAYGFQPIQPGYQYASTFYGLAKAAGDTTQSQSSNAVGTYTQEAKAAIQTMLDVPAKADIPEVPVQDVQVNGTSVLQDGVANVPKANASSMGVVGIEGSVTGFSYGLGFYTDSSQLLVVKGALPTQIKTGTQGYKPIVPMTQHESVFYGLAKAAGHDEKDSAEPLGTYTSEAKTAIKNMLGIEEGLKVVRLI